MDIVKVCMIGILGCMIILFFDKNNKEYTVFISIIAGLIILSFAIKYLYSIVSVVNTYALKASIDSLNIKTVLKIIGVAYIGQFGKEICTDSGNSSLANKVSLFTKVMIIYLSLPLMVSLFSYIEEVL